MDNDDPDTIGKGIAVIGRQVVSTLRLTLLDTDKEDEALLAAIETPVSAEGMISALRRLVRKMPTATDSLELLVLTLELRRHTGIWSDSDEDFVSARRLLASGHGEGWMRDFVEINLALRDESANKLREAEAQYRALAVKAGYAGHVALNRLGLLACRRGDF